MSLTPAFQPTSDPADTLAPWPTDTWQVDDRQAGGWTWDGTAWSAPSDPADPSRGWSSATEGPTVPALFGPGTLGNLGRDSAYLLLALPITIASFTVLVTGLSLAAGLLITVVGIPVAVATLAVAVGFGRLERARLAARGTVLAPVHYAPPRGTGFRGMFGRLADPLRWAAVLHGIGAMALSIFTFSVAVTWWAGSLGGLTYWFWQQWLPEGEVDGLVDLLNLQMTESQLNLIWGLVFAATIVPVIRWCTTLHVGWARLLLTGTSRRVLAAQIEDLEARRTAAASAETQSLRRLERDIHDGPQQRLVRLGMDLSIAERRLDDDPEAARALLSAARAQAADTLAELRALSRGIAPPVLADRGLSAALTSVAARSTVPTSVDVALPDSARPAEAIESAAYFVVAEALTNTAKHAAASTAAVRVWSAGTGADAVLSVEVEDDGVGGAEPAKGHGLAGLVDRVEGLGGLLTVTSPAGGPTLLRATLPWS
jgi:signal transduction histidine kinase